MDIQSSETKSTHKIKIHIISITPCSIKKSQAHEKLKKIVYIFGQNTAEQQNYVRTLNQVAL